MMKNKKRIDWIDIAKGIAIFLMVIGHTSMPELGRKFIWSFHMPIFFIISGMLYNEEKVTSIIPFIKKRVLTLVVPFLFFSFIIFSGSQITTTPVAIIDVLYRGWGGYALWFVQVLFVTEILYCIITPPCGLIKNQRIRIVTLVLIYLTGYLLYYWDVHFPWSLNVVCWGLTFYAIGNICKKILINIQINKCLTAVCVFLLLATSYFLPRTDMCSNNQGLFVLNTLQALFGSITIFSLAKQLCLTKYVGGIKKFFIWAGNNTFLIMGCSQILVIILNDTLFNGLPLYWQLLKHVFIWVLLWLFGLILNKYLPIFVGKK